MQEMRITLATSVVLAALFIMLSVRVMVLRTKMSISLGSLDPVSFSVGDEHKASPLFVATRSHANFSEYVPLSLLMLGLIEYDGSPQLVVMMMAALLVLGRVLHPFGMNQTAPNVFRAGGITLNLLMLSLAISYGGYRLMAYL